MPTVQYLGKSIECPPGANLRMVLLRSRLPVYNSVAQALNCRGRGVCGACAMHIEGEVSEPTAAELRRLSLPPHRPDSGLRLACQCSVEGDLVVTKQAGLWGQRSEASS